MDADKSRFATFDRAIFAFDEAIRLWRGNAAAHEGLNNANMAYVEYNLQQENYERGVDLPNKGNPQH